MQYFYRIFFCLIELGRRIAKVNETPGPGGWLQYKTDEAEMTGHQRIWALARKELAGAVSFLGYPEEFADLLARQLGCPGAMERLASYLYQAKPGSVEMIIDETLAIRSEIEAWREKKESREAQEGYNRWLNSAERLERIE